MIKLTALTGPELDAVDAALAALDGALTLLLERGAVNEQDGVDLEALSDALADELGRRAHEDAEYRVGSAMARGEVVPVQRPDGQWGYAPAG